MGPVIIGILGLACLALVWLGRQDPARAAARLRYAGARVAGYTLLGVSLLMVMRGLWEAALLPAGLGWWLASGGSLKLYLDRRFPGWRHNVDENADTRAFDPRRADVMTPKEAYEILGLQPGQSREAIGVAYRAAMKKVHPDQGGSPEQAVRLNQARDVLLRRHA